MSGSSGVPARRSRYTDPGDFVGPLRPGEREPDELNVFERWWRDYKAQGPASVKRFKQVAITPVVTVAKSAASAASGAVKKGMVWVVLGAVGFMFIAFFLRQLAGRLVRG